MPSTGERRRPWLRARLHPSLHPRLLGAALALLESSLEVLSVYILGARGAWLAGRDLGE